VLTEFLKIPPNGKSWHDNPYHEYLVRYRIPEEAIIGFMSLNLNDDDRIRTLIPALGNSLTYEGLLASLARCRLPFNTAAPREHTSQNAQAADEISEQDIQAASSLARDLGLAAQDHFVVMTMFLSLRPRKWNRDAWAGVMHLFDGKTYFSLSLLSDRRLHDSGVQFPSSYLYRSMHSIIPSKMVEVIEWVSQ
jgi:hypothetical protein